MLRFTQDLRPGLLSAVPTGLIRYALVYPGLASWATFSRPYGTEFVKIHPDMI
jgi:hypothetical protein